MRQKAHIGRKLARTLRNSRKGRENSRVDFAGIGLPGNGEAAVKAHFLGNKALQLAALFVVAVKQLKKARLRTCGSL